MSYGVDSVVQTDFRRNQDQRQQAPTGPTAAGAPSRISNVYPVPVIMCRLFTDVNGKICLFGTMGDNNNMMGREEASVQVGCL